LIGGLYLLANLDVAVVRQIANLIWPLSLIATGVYGILLHNWRESVAIHAAGKLHLKQQTLASLEEAFDPAQFIRIHRSYLVNVGRVTRIEPHTKDSRIAILRDGTKLPVSQSGYARISKLMG
jgi:hypothetical protein